MRNSGRLTDSIKNEMKRSPKVFPGSGKIDYYLRFQTVEEHMNRDVHPQVMMGALAKDKSWLTDHGPEHIATVIDRASDIVNTSSCKLTGYEIYLLLVAIHFHDVGNVLGRDDHEKRVEDFMLEAGSLLGSNTPELRMIKDIAVAHGGKIEGSQDTISRLSDDTADVRLRLLAAILRFADEIADDHTRASDFILGRNILYKHNEVFHYYSDRLKQVNVTPGSIKLVFEINREILCRSYGKGKAEDKYIEVNIVDFIFERCVKMHLERIYCMRFTRPCIDIGHINVDIRFYDDRYMNRLDQLSFRLAEAGYPVAYDQSIGSICPELENVTYASLREKWGNRS